MGERAARNALACSGAPVFPQFAYDRERAAWSCFVDWTTGSAPYEVGAAGGGLRHIRDWTGNGSTASRRG
jgi:hypothetical protein